MLEDHRDGVPAQRAERSSSGLGRVLTGDLDRPRGRLDQADQRANERRLARAGKTHHDEDLARPDLERHVGDGCHATGLRPQLRARQIGVGRADDAVGLRAEDLPDPTRADNGLNRGPIRGWWRRVGDGIGLGLVAHGCRTRLMDHPLPDARLQPGATDGRLPRAREPPGAAGRQRDARIRSEARHKAPAGRGGGHRRSGVNALRRCGTPSASPVPLEDRTGR